MQPVKIHMYRNAETRYPFGEGSPDPDWFEPIGFPPPWPKRPWIYAVMVASANEVVAWRRQPGEEHPVIAILGGKPRERAPERIADLLHMRHLRSYGDCSVGAETQRDQRGLIQTPQEPWEREVYQDLQPVSEALYRFRGANGLTRHPRNIRYSRSGQVDRDGDLSDPLFSTPGVEVIVIATPEGADLLHAAGSEAKGVELIVEPLLDAAGLVRAHQRLFAAHGVRYLDCEGGETMLHALHAAGILDEVFVTFTDVIIDPARHDGVKYLLGLTGAERMAEGKISRESAWKFQRWRFNQR